MTIKRLMIISMLLAAAIVIGYLESLIPLFIPGVRLGLANVIILIMLYEFKFYEALIVDLLRIFIISLIRGTFLSPIFFMALVGGMLSYLIMLLFTRFKKFSPIGVSVLGSLFHAVGQILVAIVLMSTVKIVYYLPFIALLSVVTGIISGLIAKMYLKRSITKNFIEGNNDFEEENENI
jgi:heptaprenyl diphosphate synthase